MVGESGAFHGKINKRLIMISKFQKKRNNNIFEAIAIARKEKGKNKTGLKNRPVKSLKGKSELRL